LPYFEKARSLAPITPAWVVADEFGALLDAGRYQEARDLSSTYLKKAFDRPAALGLVAIAYLKTGDIAAAKTKIEEAKTLNPKLSLANFKPYNIAYIDQSIPEKSQYIPLRELGIPEAAAN
jgi:tetratricopeptide (TPR) repeat protein